MSVTVELDLPDALLKQAREFGLLENGRMAELLTDEVRRRVAGRQLKSVLDEVRATPGEPMPLEEITAEVKAARVDRQSGEAGR